MDDFKFFFMLFVAMVVVIGGSVGVYVGCKVAIEKPACTDFARMSGQESWFSVGTGCLIKQNGRWVDYDVVVGKKYEVTVKGDQK